MKTLFYGFFLMLAQVTTQAQTTKPNFTVPTPSQVKFAESEFGVIFHYDLHVFDNQKYSQEANRISPVDDYNIFNPTQLNTDQWIKSAKEGGAKFAVLTVTHETGFALYQSDVNPYCLKAVKWRDGKGDIVLDFVNSCRKYNIAPGIYVGIRWNSIFGIHNFKAEGEEAFARNRQLWYKHLCEKMVTELCTRYGKLFMIWFDGGADDPKGDGPDVLPIVTKYQPDCLFYHNIQRADFRWGGSETGTVEYPCWASFPLPYSHHKQSDTQKNHLELLKHGDPNGQHWMQAMADSPLRGANGRHEWFWEPGDENAVYSTAKLTDMYYKSVGRNATLILGLTPNNDGLLDRVDVDRLKAFGDTIRTIFGNPLQIVAGQGKKITIKLSKKHLIDHCVIQEDVAKGERIREYRIEGKIGGRWKTLCQGTSVGNKRIERFPAVEVTQLRLIIDKATDIPQVKFVVYTATH